jgi:hypothetical protein
MPWCNNVDMAHGFAKMISLLLFSLLSSGCGSTDEPIDPTPVVVSPKPIVENPRNLPAIGSILFVGNSLTETNNLPELVRAVAEEKGFYLRTESITLDDTSLEDHWNNGRAQQLIDREDYSFVVVQQGPSSQSDGRTTLQEYGARFKELCEKNNTQLAFFMVWPAKVNYQTFDGVIQNYTEAAKVTNAVLCPVGKVWKDYMDETKDFSYYGPDLFHPSRKGSDVAARVIFSALFP